jgi:hypothetical protein
LQLTDPTLDLRRNLNQPEDREVIEYQTTTPGGVYLRLASLPQLSTNGWSNVQIRLNSGENLPAIPGVSGEPSDRTSHHDQGAGLRLSILAVAVRAAIFRCTR